MVTRQPSPWPLRTATFLLWALAAASVAFWGLRLAGEGSSAALVPVAQRGTAAPDPAALARLLGAGAAAVAAPAAGPAPAVPLATRFSLLGVVSDAEGQGAALISVDGRPAKPFRVGSQVDEGIVLQSVQGRSAVLAASRNGPPLATLELPSKKAATAGPTTAAPTPASPNL